MNAIETRALTKKYGDKLVVDHCNLAVKKGEVYGFVGHNGAGKSTIMKMIAGLIAPTDGTVLITGKDISGKDVPARIGVLIENPGLYPHMTALDNMMMKALCLGVIEPKKECLRLLDTVGLHNLGKKKAGRFSMGMKQRLGLALALLGSPDILLLDEPLNGLDPEGVREIRNLIIDLNREHGVTVLVSSHALEQLEKMATQYGVIRGGRIIRQFSAQEMEEECREYLHVRTSNSSRTVALLTEHLPKADIRTLDHGLIEIRGERETKRVAHVLNPVSDIEILELYVRNRNTEDYFVELMGGISHV